MSLYLIEILHQTTTMYDFYMKDMELYLIEILHQTTTPFEGFCPLSELYLIEILHQTTTLRPVRRLRLLLYLIEILHQTTTFCEGSWIAEGLYLIEILHQTTTVRYDCTLCFSCILSKFYIKPQHSQEHRNESSRCILSKFYIKPQQLASRLWGIGVVSYRNSTSNHNFGPKIPAWISVVSYRNSTSNHNLSFDQLVRPIRCILSKFYIKPQRCILYNILGCGCILSKFYIKPQLLGSLRQPRRRCILSKFYIKPQRYILHHISDRSCILSKFYIKPQRRASYWLIKCYLRAVCHYKNTIGCSDEASLMHFPYFKERK